MTSPGHRLADRLLLVTNLLVANGVAAFYIVMYVQPEAIGLPPMGTHGLEHWAVLAGSIVLLLWNFAWLVRRREKAPPSNWVLSETPTGPVRVAREALENGLRQAGEALPEVTRLRVQLDTATPKRILVTGFFQCAEATNNLAASQRLRQAMSDRLGEMLRPTDGARIEYELEFQGFAGKLGKKAGDVPPPEPPPFTGPKYPIDDEPMGGSS
jgi:hypothetical protein